MSSGWPVHQLIAPDVKLGRDVRIYGFVNLYGCEIGDETGIGSGTTLLDGITVAENAAVGAGSVVTKDVPPNTTVAGNSARILRDFFRKDECKNTVS
jgi:acetyltransferase-like isoleucine patch superfamily enzyme